MEAAYAVLGSGANTETVAAWNAAHGLDKPLVVQYFNYLSGIILRFDFGLSFNSNLPVTDTILRVVQPTIKISMIGFMFVVLLGVPLGVLCAVKQGSFADNSISFISMTLTAIPAFLIGMVLMLVFAIKLRWLPSFGLSTWKHYILPVLAGGLPGLTTFIRFTRSAMLDTVRQDYIRTARSKGHSELSVIFGVALRNAMLPIAAFIGSILATILASSVVIERVFSIPGIGSQIVTSINYKDTPVILGCVLFLSAFYIIVTILVDIAFTLIDPRVKASFVATKGRRSRKVEAGIGAIVQESGQADWPETGEGGDRD